MSVTHGVSIQVLPDIDAVSHEAAKLFITTADRCVSAHGRFAVAVSGGSTPGRFFSLLGSDIYAGMVDWSRVHFFWVDERCVRKKDKESNFRGAWDSLLSQISIPESNIHRIKGEKTPEDGAQEYEYELTRFFGADTLPAFDLIFLGMGEDGHTASLFPASDSLKEAEKLAVPVYIEKLKSWRVTLTLPILNNAHSIAFLVTGKNKADVLKEILDKKSKKYPAGLIKPNNGSLIWLVDKDAAGVVQASGPLHGSLK